MSPRQTKEANDAFFKGVTRAMKRAAKEARRMARIHGTKVWVMIDGKVVGLKP
jgi:hypothetical protein